MKTWEYENEEVILFWGGVFSNWFKVKFVLDDIEWNCVEQYMMAQKAIRFDDEVILKQILNTKDPKTQKALGRQVAEFDPVIWKAECRALVYPAILEKYKQNQFLADILLSTGDKLIAEASPKDAIWGIGMHFADPASHNPVNWIGENYLGLLTMLAREDLRA